MVIIAHSVLILWGGKMPYPLVFFKYFQNSLIKLIFYMHIIAT